MSPLGSAVVVNSYGRSGSSMLTKSIRNIPLHGPIKHLNVKQKDKNLWDLQNDHLRRGLVYKTHDYPPNCLLENTRIIYVLGSPIATVLSLVGKYLIKGEPWMKRHFSNLKASYENFWKILDDDILGLENHYDAWKAQNRFPILFVKYETMWQNVSYISDFIGAKIMLPEYKERLINSQITPEMKFKITNAYSDFEAKISLEKEITLKNLH